MRGFPRFAAIAVTVSDLERSTRWYRELLAADPVLDEDEPSQACTTVVAFDGGSCWAAPASRGRERRLDERRVGLDQVSFACRDRGGLEAGGAAGRAGHHAPRIRDAAYGCGSSPRPRIADDRAAGIVAEAPGGPGG